MKIYISGKITGLPLHEAAAAFSKAENDLGLVFEVVNPMRLPHEHGQTWCEYMAEDIRALLGCDAIYMLSGYKASKGAKVELAIAKELKLIILYE